MKVSSLTRCARQACPARKCSGSAAILTAALGLSTIAPACSSLQSEPSTGAVGAAGADGGGQGSVNEVNGGRADGGTTSQGGSSGAPSSTDGQAAAPPMRGPTAPTNGSSFPFPQNRQSANCIYPTGYLNSDVQAAYAQWKNDTLTSSGAGGFLRVQRTASDPKLEVGSTVSEGIGYGMLLAVYMNDQQVFDGLWSYEQQHLDQYGLMNWYISADGTMALGTGGATDADEDMAFALVMADSQWGGQGSLSETYHQAAIDQITAVWVHEVLNSNLMLPGDTWGDDTTVNISYFAPAYYRVFEQVGGTLGSYNPTWDATIDTVYSTIDASLNATNGNENNGLVPAWCTSAGAPNPNAIMGGNATNYQYDSCRTPFRIALDWCWNAEPRAQAYIAKTSAFFSNIGAKSIVDGYGLDGTPEPANAGQLSAAFIGPAGVGAMSSSTYQSFVDDAYAEVSTRMLLAGGTYYEDSWTVLSLLMMTGNFLDYTALP